MTQRDPLTRRMATPSEQVPTHLEGATAAREFLANATPAARNAFEAREVTRILDGVSGQGGATSERIRAAMRQNEDLLALLPEARGRLQRLALAHQGREAVERSPLGRIAERPDVKRAIDTLFPTKPVEGSAADVGAAVGAISRSNSLAARELVRTYLGTEFAAKTKDLQGGANQVAGRSSPPRSGATIWPARTSSRRSEPCRTVSGWRPGSPACWTSSRRPAHVRASARGPRSTARRWRR